MLADSGKWPYQFGLTYSVTLSSNELETSLVVRNTGSTNYDFHVLFHTYLAVDVSEPDLSLSLLRRIIAAIDLLSENIDKRLIRCHRNTGHHHNLRQRARILLLP